MKEAARKIPSMLRMRPETIVVCVVLITCIDVVHCKDISTPQSFLTNYVTYKKTCQAMGYIKHQCKGDFHKTTIAFHARIKRNLHKVGQHKPVIFGTVTLNKGGAYDASAGMFSAPRDGVYSFDWTVLACSGKTDFHTELVMGNKIIAYNYCHDSKAGISLPCSHAVVVQMKTGDKVWIRTHSSGSCVNAEWSSFSGFSL